MVSDDFRELLYRREFWNNLRREIHQIFGPHLLHRRSYRFKTESTNTEQEMYDSIQQIQLAITDVSNCSEEQLEKLELKYNQVRDLIVIELLKS